MLCVKHIQAINLKTRQRNGYHTDNVVYEGRKTGTGQLHVRLLTS